ncbi:MAG: tetratricopeptide repeat protein [Desulfohalobiaceae bacterium]
MSQELTKARSKLSGVHSLLKQEKLLSAVISLYEALGTYLRIQLLKHERTDFQRQLEKTVFELSSDPNLKQTYPLVIQYEPGQEKELHTQIKMLLDELQQDNISEAQDQLARIEEHKQSMLQQARQHLQNQDQDQADQAVHKLLHEYSDNTELKIEISDLYLEHDLHQEALKYLKLAYQEDPNSVNVFNKLGMVLRKGKKFELAEKSYLEALKKGPDDEYLLFNLGRVYIDWKKWEKAEQTCQKALEVNPEFKEARQMQAFARKMLQKQLQ